jgi:type II secretory pathway pseudopilin PulG
MKFLPYVFVLFVFGIFIAIILPNFQIHEWRDRRLDVRRNMHTLSTTLETYAVDWGKEPYLDRSYPDNIEILFKEANKPGAVYWKDFKNPYTGKTGLGKAFDNIASLLKPENIFVNISTGKIEIINIPEGMVFYNPVKTKNGVKKFYIYGAEKENVFIFGKGKVHFLTNE